MQLALLINNAPWLKNDRSGPAVFLPLHRPGEWEILVASMSGPNSTDAPGRRGLSARAVLVLSALFLAVHLVGLTRDALWIDELHTYGAAAAPLDALIGNRLSAGHMPAYFLIIKAWGGCAGFTEWSLRFPSVFFGTLAFAVFVTMAARYLQDRRALFAAGFIFFFSPFVLWLCQEARMYSMLVFASVLASCLLLRFVEQGSGWALAGYGVAVFAGLSLHVLFVLQVAAHGVFVAAHARQWFSRWVTALILPALVVTPTLLAMGAEQVAVKAQGRLKWPPLDDAFNKLAALALGDPAGLSDIPPAVRGLQRTLGMVFVVVFGAAALRRLKRRPSSSAAAGDAGCELLLRYSLYWLLVPLGILIVMAIFAVDRVSTVRYHSPGVPALIVILGCGWSALSRHIWPEGSVDVLSSPHRDWRRRLGARLLHGGLIAPVFFFFVQVYSREIGIREGAAYLNERYRPGDGVVFCSNGAMNYAFPFYGPRDAERVGVSKVETDEAALNRRIDLFAQGKRALWLFLHDWGKSPLDAILKRRPERYTLFAEACFTSATVVQGYHIRGNARSGTAD